MLVKIIKNIFFTVIIMVSVPVSAAETIEGIQGSWLGSMQIPDGPKLRIGIEIFKKADGTWGGNAASLDQDTRYIPVGSVTVTNNIMNLTLAAAPISITGPIASDHTSISATFKQGGGEFPLELHKVAALPERERPQKPKNHNGYSSSEVRIENAADNVWLAGTLTAPVSKGRHPAVLLIAGSGPNQRDSYFSGHRLFNVIADHLSRQGYIVLRMDKRGVYKSSGTFHTATIDDFARDSRATLSYLKKNNHVMPNNIHILGHSEGSLIAAMLGEETGIKSIISLAGPGMSVYDILVLQDQTEPQAKGAPIEALPILKNFSIKFYDTVLQAKTEEERFQSLQSLYDNLVGPEKDVVNRWVERTGTLNVKEASGDNFKKMLQKNPLNYWKKVKLPVLILNGSKDSQVPAALNSEGIYTALSTVKNGTEKLIFPNLNHMFQTAQTGAVNEYAKIDETINMAVLQKITAWLNKFN